MQKRNRPKRFQQTRNHTLRHLEMMEDRVLLSASPLEFDSANVPTGMWINTPGITTGGAGNYTPGLPMQCTITFDSTAAVSAGSTVSVTLPAGLSFSKTVASSLYSYSTGGAAQTTGVPGGTYQGGGSLKWTLPAMSMSEVLSVSFLAIPSSIFGPNDTLTVTATLTNSSTGGTDTSSTTASYQAPTSTSGTQTNTSLTPSASPAYSGSTVILTANVTANNGNPSGSVSFYNNYLSATSPGTLLGTSILSGGMATLNLPVSYATSSTYSITAQYVSDGSFEGSTSGNLPLNVIQCTPTVSVSSAANPSTKGISVTLSATVGKGANGTSTPAGTVTFSSGGTTLGTATLSSAGIASLGTSALMAGTDTISATYNPASGSDYSKATNSTFKQQVNLPVPTVSVISSNSPSVSGGSVNFTASVSGAAGTPTGSITFVSSGITLGTAALSNGTATLYSVSSLTTGSYSIQANYTPDTASSTVYQTSSGTVSQTVNSTSATPTSTTLGSTTAAFVGVPITFTATVSPRNTGAAVAGSVTFLDGSTLLGTGTISGTSAQYTTTSLLAGSHSITASYSGNYQSSTSTAVTQVINLNTPTITSITSSSVSAGLGNPVTFSVTLGGTVNGVSSYPTGPVVFWNNYGTSSATSLGTVALTNASAGHASLVVSTLPAGTNSITAVYGGNTNYSGLSSAALSQTVVLPTPTISLSTSSSTIISGNAVTLTANTNISLTGASEFITFYNNDGLASQTSLGTALLSNGVASLTCTSLPIGTNSITAVYAGDSTNYDPATSSVLTQTVNAPIPNVTLTTSSSSLVQGATVTFTATVTDPTTGAEITTGTVNVYSNGSLLNSTPVSLGASGATYSTSNLSGGSQAIQAVYSGQTGVYQGNASNCVAETVTSDNAVPVTMTLSSSSLLVSYGTSVTLSVNVAPVTAGAPLTGSVYFSNGSIALGSTSLSASGSGSITLNNVPVGINSIVASYSGNYDSDTVILNQFVTQAISNTQLATINTSYNVGSVMTLKAVVNGVTGAAAPTGTVSFYNQSQLLGTATLSSNGQALFSTASLPTGAYSITAIYNGDSNYESTESFSQLTNVILPTPTITVLNSATGTIVNGTSVTLTATVGSGATGLSTPTGSVTFKSGSTPLAIVTLNGGVASYTTTSLAVGTDTITCVYSGDSSYSSVTSSEISQTVVLPSPTIGVNTSSSSVTIGALASLTATVSSNGTQPTGTVAFTDATGATIGTGLLTSGSCTVQVPFTSATTVVPTVGNSGFESPVLSYGQIWEDPTVSGVDWSFSGSAGITTNGSGFTGGNPNTPQGNQVVYLQGTGSSTTQLLSGFQVDQPYQISLDAATRAGYEQSSIMVSVNGVSIGTFTPSTSYESVTSAPFRPSSSTVTVTITNVGPPVDQTTFIDNIQLAALTSPVQPITATYLGNSTYAQVNALAPVISVQTSSEVATTTKVTSNASSLYEGNSATLTATVSVPTASLGSSITGSVTFMIGSTVLATVPIASTGSPVSTVTVTSTVTSTSLVTGSNTITAYYNYGGTSGNYSPSNSSITINLRQYSSTLQLTTPTVTWYSGSTISLQASVTGSDPGVSPTGTVTFYNGTDATGDVIGTGSITANGLATVSYTLPSVSSSTAISICAQYSGNSNYLSSSGTLTNTNTALTLTNLAFSTSASMGSLNWTSSGLTSPQYVPGNVLSYTLTVTNHGSQINPGTQVQFTAPQGYTIVNSNQPSGSSQLTSGTVLTWTLGTLAASSSTPLVVNILAAVIAPISAYTYNPDGSVSGPAPNSGVNGIAAPVVQPTVTLPAAYVQPSTSFTAFAIPIIDHIVSMTDSISYPPYTPYVQDFYAGTSPATAGQFCVSYTVRQLIGYYNNYENQAYSSANRLQNAFSINLNGGIYKLASSGSKQSNDKYQLAVLNPNHYTTARAPLLITNGTIDANRSSRAFYVDQYQDLVLSHVAVLNGLENGGTISTSATGKDALGGGIYVNAGGTLNLQQSSVFNCAALGAQGTAVTADVSTKSSGRHGVGFNAAGGGIYGAAGSNISIDGQSSIINNRALGGRGGKVTHTNMVGGTGGSAFGGGIAINAPLSNITQQPTTKASTLSIVGGAIFSGNALNVPGSQTTSKVGRGTGGTVSVGTGGAGGNAFGAGIYMNSGTLNLNGGSSIARLPICVTANIQYAGTGYSKTGIVSGASGQSSGVLYLQPGQVKVQNAPTGNGLMGSYYNLPAATNQIQPAASSNGSWLGNQTPVLTTPLLGPIDFPNIQSNGFADSVGNPAYYNLGNGNNYNVEARWYGEILIPGSGTSPVPINFATTSDDGSMLYIDGNAVVSNNAFQGAHQSTGLVSLTPGLHTIDIEYFQGGGGATMDVQWDPTGGTSFVDIPNTAFFLPPTEGLLGSYYNLPAAANQIQPAVSSNSSWLGNQTPTVTTPLLGPIDFPNIQSNGFADSVGNPAYYNLGNGNNNNVEARWYGNILIPGSGTTPVPINFATTSDDGSMLYIDGNAVVNNNYTQGATQRTGLVHLTPGLHAIDIEYYQGVYGASMDVQWDPTGGSSFVDIPNSAFSHASPTGIFSFPGTSLSTVPVISDAGFETPSVGSGGSAYVYAPSGTPWAFTPQVSSGGSGITGNGSGFTSANSNAPEGSQVAFLQGPATISQSLSGFQVGLAYSVTFEAAARLNDGSGNTFTVSANGAQIGTFSPQGGYLPYVTSLFRPTSSTVTITFTGAAGSTGYQTSLIDEVQVQLGAPVVPNGGFETPALSGNTYPAVSSLASEGVIWSGTGGITPTNTNISGPPAPQGNQYAYLYHTGASLSQTISGFQVGQPYYISMAAAARLTYPTTAFQVSANGVVIGNYTVNVSSFEALSTTLFTPTSSTVTLTITNSGPGGVDQTCFIDSIQVHSLVTISPNQSVTAGTTSLANLFLPTVTTAADATVSGTSVWNLRTAVEAANALSATGMPITLNLPAGTYTLSQGSIPVTTSGTGSLAILGVGAGTSSTASTMINGGNNSAQGSLFSVSGATVTFSNLTLENGSGVNGGAISVVNTKPSQFVSLSNVSILGCSASGDGGGIYQTGGTLSLTNIKFTSNSSSGNGGAVFANGSAKVFAKKSGLTMNKGSAGGAFALSANANLSLVSDKLTSNTATAGGESGGGGIYQTSGALKITNSNFISNKASWGAGIFMTSITFTMSGGSITSNIASGCGGGIFVQNPTSSLVSLSGVTFTSNQSKGGNGGGIEGVNVALTLSSCNFASNTASGYGGALYVIGSSVLKVSGGTYSSNTAANGGAIVASSLGGGHPQATVSSATFNGNSSSGTGGGLYATHANIVLKNDKFKKNKAASRGGGTAFITATALLKTLQVSSNSITGSDSSWTSTGGGGLYAYHGSLQIQNSAFKSNKSAAAPGAGLDVTATRAWNLTNVNITSNKVNSSNNAYGGGLFLNGGTLNATNISIVNNALSTSGGTTQVQGGGLFDNSAIMNFNGSLNISGNTLSGQSGGNASGAGVRVNTYGVMNVPSSWSLTNNTISGVENGVGAGVSFWNGSNISGGMPTLSGNSAPAGGNNLAWGVWGTSDDSGTTTGLANFSASGGSLRSALNWAQSLADGGWASVGVILGYNSTYYLNSSLSMLTSGQVTISGQGGGNPTLNVQGNGRVMTIGNNGQGSYILNSLNITGGRLYGGFAPGGGIYLGGGTLKLNNSDVSNNLAQGGNGYSPPPSQDWNTWNKNHSERFGVSAGWDGEGGGIYQNSGNLYILGSTVIQNNLAQGGQGGTGTSGHGVNGEAGQTGGRALGGGIFQQSGQLYLAASARIINNTANAGRGGAGGHSQGKTGGNGGAGGNAWGGGLEYAAHVQDSGATFSGNSSPYGSGGPGGSPNGKTGPNGGNSGSTQVNNYSGIGAETYGSSGTSPLNIHGMFQSGGSLAGQALPLASTHSTPAAVAPSHGRAIVGLVLELHAADGKLIAKATSDSAGLFHFNTKYTGTGYLQVELPRTHKIASRGTVTDTGIPSTFDPTTGKTDLLHFVSGQLFNQQVHLVLHKYDSVLKTGPNSIELYNKETHTPIWRQKLESKSYKGGFSISQIDVNGDKTADYLVIPKKGPATPFLLDGRTGAVQKIKGQVAGNLQKGFTVQAQNISGSDDVPDLLLIPKLGTSGAISVINTQTRRVAWSSPSVVTGGMNVNFDGVTGSRDFNVVLTSNTYNKSHQGYAQTTLGAHTGKVLVSGFVPTPTSPPIAPPSQVTQPKALKHEVGQVVPRVSGFVNRRISPAKSIR